jgi:hypothetical protein
MPLIIDATVKGANAVSPPHAFTPPHPSPPIPGACLPCHGHPSVPVDPMHPVHHYTPGPTHSFMAKSPIATDLKNQSMICGPSKGPYVPWPPSPVTHIHHHANKATTVGPDHSPYRGAGHSAVVPKHGDVLHPLTTTVSPNPHVSHPLLVTPFTHPMHPVIDPIFHVPVRVVDPLFHPMG